MRGRSVRKRCISATAAVPRAVIAPMIRTIIHHGRRRRIPSHMPAAAKSVIAAPKFEPVHGEPATTAHAARSSTPAPTRIRCASEHRGSEHDADLDVRHPEEAAAVQLSAARERGHGRGPAQRGLDAEDGEDDRAACRERDEDASARLDPPRERRHRPPSPRRGTESRSRTVRDGRWPTSSSPRASHGNEPASAPAMARVRGDRRPRNASARNPAAPKSSIRPHAPAATGTASRRCWR